MGVIHRGILFLVLPIGTLLSQIVSYPYTERFDSVETPVLPPDWQTSTNRLATGDFFSTTTSPRSSPFAVQSTNSTIAQLLVSPAFDFTTIVPNELRFFIARSGTHTSAVLIEASLDDGRTWPVLLHDTLRHPGSTGYMQTVIQLPETLTNHERCRFRWRIFGGMGGTSGTFRIDDISLSVHTSNDLRVTRVHAFPVMPTFTDHLTLTASIKSMGILPASDYDVRFYLDSNHDGFAEGSEHFASIPGPVLPPGDSITVGTSHPPLPPGPHRFLVVSHLPVDQNRTNDTAAVLVEVGAIPGSIVMNEIMYAPAGDEPEWVELFNTTTISLNLKNWKVSDNRTSSKSLFSSSDFVVEAGGLALIVKDSSFFSLYDSIDVPVAVSEFSSLNNTTPDAAVLFDFRNVMIDSAAYEPGWGKAGNSLERIDPLSSSIDPSNWAVSMSPRGGTPGRKNSVALAELDLRFESVAVFGLTITALVTNSGRTDVHSFAVSLFTIQGDESTEFGKMIFSGTLARGATTYLSYRWSEAPPGKTAVILQIDFSGDQRIEDNTDTVHVIRDFQPETIVFNEIMFEPLSGQNEWVELTNRSNNPIDLCGWKIRDMPTSSGSVNSYTITEPNTILHAEDFLVLSADSSLLALYPGIDRARVVVTHQSGGLGFGNAGDQVILTDLTGKVIDSLDYSASWHHPRVKDTRGRSLERIRPDLATNDPRNWSSSANPLGGSPGATNTIFTAGSLSVSSLSFSPNPFSPDGDGHDDFCTFTFNLPARSSVVHIRIFDLEGRLIQTLADGEVFGSRGEVIWDGMESSRRKARVGPHIVLLEASSGEGSVYSIKGVVVVATRL